MKKLLAALCCLVSLGALAKDEVKDAPGNSELSAVPSLEVARYMGTWYEIAKYPNWFQKNCSGETRAEYALMDDGRVKVVNRCRLTSGEMNEASAVARQLGPATSAKLEVRFAPAGMSFLPFVWGDYWVIDLDEGYQLVAVSEPKREYLWILSRTKQVNPQQYQALLSRLQQKGFDLSKLEPTPQ